MAYFTFCYSPIRDENGTVVGMLDTVTETTDTVRADLQLKTVNKELGHRLKNVLAVTQAVTFQTLRRSTSLDQAKESISERLAALGRATDVLTASDWDAADLRIIADVAIGGHESDRIAISGPSVFLPSSQAISMTLALHELATNATKYGALAGERGQVEVSWQITQGTKQDDARLSLVWIERDGPAVSPPTSRGFGSALVERTLKSSFKGTVLLEFRPEGLAFSLDAPLPTVTTRSAGG